MTRSAAGLRAASLSSWSERIHQSIGSPVTSHHSFRSVRYVPPWPSVEVTKLSARRGSST